MHGFQAALLALGLVGPLALAESYPGNSSSVAASAPTPFSSSFGTQPDPPIVNTDFRANWYQHKWDVNVSNIAAGFIYHSPANAAVRVDAAFDGVLQSSLFDYSTLTEEGLVTNRLYTLSPSVGAEPQCDELPVVPTFPLFLPEVLVTNEAVYAGTDVDHFNGVVTKWEFFFAPTIPVTIYLNTENTIVGFDYFSQTRRTKTITRFFNIILGDVDKSVFEFPTC